MVHAETDQNLLGGDQLPKKTVFEKTVNLLLDHGAILTTVIIVLGLGCGIAAVNLIPKIQQAREQERRELAKKNLKALGEALHRHQEQQTQSSPRELPQPANDQPSGPPAP